MKRIDLYVDIVLRKTPAKYRRKRIVIGSVIASSRMDRDREIDPIDSLELV